jgi:RNA polymerase sigma-70 factor (ECF subfamily)
MRGETGLESGIGAASVEYLNQAIVAARADLLRRALYLTRDRDQAMDLVQRTVERACASRRQLRPGSNPARWLGAILTSQFIDDFRRQRASPFARGVAHDNVAPPPADPIPIWSFLGIDDVVAAMRQLPDHFRGPFELFALRGLSHRAISLRLGLPIGTIATRIFRARRLLKRILAGAVPAADRPPAPALLPRPVGPPRHPPAPGGHRGGGVGGGARLGIDHRQARAPFDVSHQGGAKLRVGGQARLVGALGDQRGPAAALGLAEHATEVMADHLGVAAARAVGGRAAEDLGDEQRHVGRVLGGHVGEQRLQNGILTHPAVEHLGQALDRRRAAGPLVKRGNNARLVAHAAAT